MKRQLIIEYLTDHPSAKASQIAAYIDLKPSHTRDYLHELMAEDVVVASGNGTTRVYALKS